MTPEEIYDDEIKGLDEAYEIEKRKIVLQYLRNKNIYKQGDILEDNMGFGEVLSCKQIYGFGKYPSLGYQCRVLTKDLKPTKKIEYRTIALSNVIRLCKRD